MKEPIWVLREVVLIAHEQSLAEFGGAAGTRDEGLLDSALSKPENPPLNGWAGHRVTGSPKFATLFQCCPLTTP